MDTEEEHSPQERLKEVIEKVTKGGDKVSFLNFQTIIKHSKMESFIGNRK